MRREGDAMATCNFCKKDKFQSEQGVKAHMKTCEPYLAEKAKKARAASGSVPQAAAAPDLSAPKLDVMKPIPEPSKQDLPPTLQQQRRTILQAIKKRVIDRSEEHTSELQSHHDLVCRLLL